MDDGLWIRSLSSKVELLEYLKGTPPNKQIKAIQLASRSRKFILMRRSRQIILTTQAYKSKSSFEKGAFQKCLENT